MVGDSDVDRLTMEREKGFEPSTSTLATCLTTRSDAIFEGLRMQERAGRCASVGDKWGTPIYAESREPSIAAAMMRGDGIAATNRGDDFSAALPRAGRCLSQDMGNTGGGLYFHAGASRPWSMGFTGTDVTG